MEQNKNFINQILSDLDSNRTLMAVTSVLIKDVLQLKSDYKDLQTRVEALEQCSKPADKKPVELPQDIKDFLKALTGVSCDGVSCGDCLFCTDESSLSNGCLQNIAFGLRRKYLC